MRAISSRRASAPSGSTRVAVRPRAACFATSRCAAPRAATCGLCVTTSTCTPPRQPRQPVADRRRGRAADVGVHLVEHQRRHRRAGRQHHLQRQHQPRQLAARGDPPQRPQLLSRIGGDQEAHRIGTARAPLGLRQRVDLGAETGLVQPQGRQFLGHRAIERAARGLARRRQRLGRRDIARPAVARGLFQRDNLGGAGVQRGQPGRQRIEQCRQVGHGHRMLARRGAQREQPLLGLFQQARVDVRLSGEPGQQGFGLGQGFLGAFQRGHRGCGRDCPPRIGPA